MRIVLDANGCVSAILFGGKPRQALDAGISRRAKIFISEAIVSELEEVPRRPKFGLTAELVRTVMAEITALAARVALTRRVSAIEEDPADNDLFDCAAEAGAEYLATGDARLLRLGEFEGIRMVDADVFWKLIKESDD